MHKNNGHFSLTMADLREFFVEKVGLTNSLILVVIVLQILIIWLIIYVYLEIGDNQYHFYMNTKTSLEKLHHIKIDKYNGDIYRELSTEEELIRKKYSRFHLRQLFKK